MKKRIIGILLTLSLTLTMLCLGALGAAAAENTATIKVGSQTYTAQVGEFIEYRISFRHSGEKLSTAQIELPVDLNGLSGYTQEDIASHMAHIAPTTADSSVVLCSNGDSALKLTGYVMNFVSTSGYSFTSEKTVMSMVFCVEKAGTYELAAKVRHVADVKDNIIIDGNYQKKDSRFTYTETVTEATLSAPALRASTDAGAIQVAWNAVPGATLYRVYVKGTNGWTKIGDTKETSFLDTNVTAGKSYTYTVRCLSKDGRRFISDYDHSGKTATYYPAPVLRLSNAVDGVSIKWDAVYGAAKYRVYVMRNGTWTKVTDTAATSATDKNVASGNTYTYTIRSMDSNGKHLSWYYRDGFSIRFVNAPDFKLSNAANGVNISWEPVKGASKYRVFYYGSKGWTKLVDTNGKSFLDTDVKSNTNYTYTVRCLSSDGKSYISDYRAGKKIRYVAAPKLRLSNGEDSVSIKWDAVAGASKYRVYVWRNNTWTKITDTAATSATDTNVTSGNTYTYTIRAMDSNNNHLSWYYTDGFSIKFIRAPQFSLSKAADGVKISWERSEGATRYRVFYYGANGWTRLSDVNGTSFVDTKVSSGKSYTYTVRCASDDGTVYISDFRAGKSITFYAAPKLTLSNTSGGVSLKWNSISGASRYRVYVKTASGWTKLTDTASTSYTHTAAKNGTSYTYTIRAMDNNGNHLSWYYTDGFTITCKR